jgi:nucleotide-binding universal stress UspA family protein
MKIFFAVDGSQAASQAVKQVSGWLCDQTDAAAFYFAPPDVQIRHAHEAEAMRERARKAIADAVFSDVRGCLSGNLALGAKTIIAEHTPTEGILLEAEKWSADMIVVGARGLSQLDKLLLGSVADGVAQNSTRPVLVVRPRDESHVGAPLKILYAYDGSKSCTAALRMAEQLHFPAGTQVLALTVIESYSCGQMPSWILNKARSADVEAMGATWQREHDDEKRQARDQLTEFMAKQSAPFDKAEVEVAEGHAAEEILRITAERGIDLIVMGVRGRNLLERLLIGSNSDKVLTHAPCSVLLARDA